MTNLVFSYKSKSFWQRQKNIARTCVRLTTTFRNSGRREGEWSAYDQFEVAATGYSQQRLIQWCAGAVEVYCIYIEPPRLLTIFLNCFTAIYKGPSTKTSSGKARGRCYTGYCLLSTVDVDYWCQLLMSTVDVACWCRLLMLTVDVNCYCGLLMSTFDVVCWCRLLMLTVDVGCWCWLLMSTVDDDCWWRLLMSTVDVDCWCQLLMSTVDVDC